MIYNKLEKLACTCITTNYNTQNLNTLQPTFRMNEIVPVIMFANIYRKLHMPRFNIVIIFLICPSGVSADKEHLN